MAFTAHTFVVPFLSYYVFCNLSYDDENNGYLWIDLTKLAQNVFTYLVNQIKHYRVLVMISIATD